MYLQLLHKVSVVIDTNFFQKQFKFTLLDVIYKQIVDKAIYKNNLA